MALATGASAWLLRSRIAAAPAPEPAVCGLGTVAAAACIVLWLLNPYLALLVVPIAHLWLLTSEPLTAARRAVALTGSLVACVPVLAAFVAASGALDLGADAPWTFTIMVADGQIGLATTLALCFVAGAVAGGVALALRRGSDEP
jgi:hypothetical protein